MKTMFDLNVILDVVANRSSWVAESARACSLATQGRRKAFVSPHVVTTLYYLVRKYADRAAAENAIDKVAALFDFAPCGRDVFRRARELPIADFEDAVVVAAAEAAGCDHIVTRNLEDFANSPIRAVSPQDFCHAL